MTRRETRAHQSRAPSARGATLLSATRLFIMRGAVACAVAIGACDDGFEPEQRAPSSPNAPNGGKDSGTTTSTMPSTTRDGGPGDARAMGAGADGSLAMGSGMGSAEAGAGSTGGSGGDGGAQPPSVQVVAACMGRGGETVCDGANLIRCGMAGNIESQTVCTNEARCRAGLTTGQCGSCDPGAANCNGAELQECNMNGEFVMKAPCPSAELCSVMNKSCNPMQCAADAVKCENGFLKRCKPDLTGFDMGVQCMSQALCSEADKRCNECMPNSKVCEGDAVMACSADGKGPAAEPCSGSTPRCLGGKCVQCKEDTDCMTTMDCRVATCDKATGMCSSTTAARGTMCSRGYCDLLGGCSQCTENSHCSASQSCSLGSCVARAPLTVSSLLGCSLTLNAGFGLHPESINETVTTAGVHVSASLTEFLFPSATIDRNTPRGPTSAAIVRADTGPRTFSVSASYSGPSNMTGSATCTARQSTESTATLTFTGGGTTLTVTLSARP